MTTEFLAWWNRNWPDLAPTQIALAAWEAGEKAGMEKAAQRLRRAYELARIFERKIAFLALSEKSHDEYSEALKELAEAEREAAVEKAPEGK